MTEMKPEAADIPRFLIKGQYVKDLSFENPHSPNSLVRPEEKPKVDVNVSLKANKFNDQHFELVMKISVRAQGQENVMFIAELDYAAIIQLVNIPEDKQEQVLFIDCAIMLFPFARRVLADVTRDGGFQPMMLEPIDFISLYDYNKRMMAKAG